MNIKTVLPALGLAVLVSVGPVAVPTAGAASQSGTPSSCIKRNGGDATACNAANSGRGDHTYRRATRRARARARCIRRNHGDWTACNAAHRHSQ